MSIDTWLAIAGILLSLPGFLLLLFTGYETTAILVALLGVVVLAAASIVHRLANLPPFSMKGVDVSLEFIDGVRRVRLTKSYRIRPNYAYLDQMTHRNIASDGSIENLCWDGKPLPKNALTPILGEYTVTVHFGNALPRWREFPGTLSYEAVDSFNGNPEGLVYVADFRTPWVKLNVHLPEARCATNVRAFRMEGAGQVPLKKQPVVSQGGRHIFLLLRRPRVGTEFMIFWDW